MLKEKCSDGFYMGGFYSPVCGKCRVYIDESMGKITMAYEPDGFILLNRDGKESNSDGGECLIFPSKEMRDWNKFAWKYCDVLFSPYNSKLVIFDKFSNDTFTEFIGHEIENGNRTEKIYKTCNYNKLGGVCANRGYIGEKLHPFDRVIGRIGNGRWYIDFFSLYDVKDTERPYKCMMSSYSEIVKYDENTEKLIGTKNDLSCLLVK